MHTTRQISDTNPPTFRFEKCVDVSDGDRCNGCFARRDVVQEAFDLPPPTADRIRRQTALVAQMSDKFIDLPGEEGIPLGVRGVFQESEKTQPCSCYLSKQVA